MPFSLFLSLIKPEHSRTRPILTDNGNKRTGRFVTTGKRTPMGQHAFDALGAALSLHRLTCPRWPQTNGIRQQLNGRIEGRSKAITA